MEIWRIKTPLGIKEYVRLWKGLISLEELVEEITTNPLFLASMVLAVDFAGTPSATDES